MCRQTLDLDRVAASGVVEGASCDAAVIELHGSCPCEENDFGAEANVVYTYSRIGRLLCLCFARQWLWCMCMCMVRALYSSCTLLCWLAYGGVGLTNLRSRSRSRSRSIAAM
jgi:hypothetical protein